MKSSYDRPFKLDPDILKIVAPFRLQIRYVSQVAAAVLLTLVDISLFLTLAELRGLEKVL